MENKEIKAFDTFDIEEYIEGLKQENKALKEKIETMEKNAQEYFFQMSLPEED